MRREIDGEKRDIYFIQYTVSKAYHQSQIDGKTQVFETHVCSELLQVKLKSILLYITQLDCLHLLRLYLLVEVNFLVQKLSNEIYLGILFKIRSTSIMYSLCSSEIRKI